MYSYARDDMIFGSHLLRRFDHTRHVPPYAMIVAAAVPAVIVLGGGVPTPTSAWWSSMTDEWQAGVPDVLRGVPVRRATQRNNAALLGAARDAFRLAGVPTSQEE